MGIVLTYSIDDRNSFQDIDNWVKQIKMHASSDVVKILVGNKCDSSKREVSYDEGKKLAEELGIQFYETSAKDNIDVTEMFLDIGSQAKAILHQGKE
jgi:GTPase SAR1 family protein